MLMQRCAKSDVRCQTRKEESLSQRTQVHVWPYKQDLSFVSRLVDARRTQRRLVNGNKALIAWHPPVGFLVHLARSIVNSKRSEHHQAERRPGVILRSAPPEGEL
eukprot:557656-Prymnesium_polylepis.1